MQVIKTEWKQRSFDGMWVKWGLVSIAELQEWNNPNWTPFIWVAVDVRERRG